MPTSDESASRRQRRSSASAALLISLVSMILETCQRADIGPARQRSTLWADAAGIAGEVIAALEAFRSI
jgi:hypothetical protein